MSTRGRVELAVLGICLARLVAAPAAAAALINPVSQNRTLFAYVQASDPPDFLTDSQSDSAPDFGLYDSSVIAQVDVSVGSVSASAQQHSSIGSDVVSMMGSAVADVLVNTPAFGSATSRFEVVFDVFQALDFTLTGYLNVLEDGSGTPGGSSVLTLTGGPGNETIVQLVSTDFLYDFNEEGLLLPGRYTLIARSEVSMNSSAAISADHQIQFEVVPEPSTELLLAGGLLVLAVRRRRLRPPAI